MVVMLVSEVKPNRSDLIETTGFCAKPKGLPDLMLCPALLSPKSNKIYLTTFYINKTFKKKKPIHNRL
jgi:hypothetical protein